MGRGGSATVARTCSMFGQATAGCRCRSLPPVGRYRSTSTATRSTGRLVPERRTPGRSEADRLDWLEDQAIYEDEVSGAAWRRAFRAAPHHGLHWPDKAGLDRRMFLVDGAEDERVMGDDGILEGRLKDHGNAPE